MTTNAPFNLKKSITEGANAAAGVPHRDGANSGVIVQNLPQNPSPKPPPKK